MIEPRVRHHVYEQQPYSPDIINSLVADVIEISGKRFTKEYDFSATLECCIVYFAYYVDIDTKLYNISGIFE